jgi:hypothetical protein
MYSGSLNDVGTVGFEPSAEKLTCESMPESSRFGVPPRVEMEKRPPLVSEP